MVSPIRLTSSNINIDLSNGYLARRRRNRSVNGRCNTALISYWVGLSANTVDTDISSTCSYVRRDSRLGID